MKAKRFIFLIILCLGVALSAQNIYYVQDKAYNNKASDDNPGINKNSPWATWQKAFNTAEAGDTVYFRDGSWFPTSTDFGWPITSIDPSSGKGNNGTYKSPIVYMNYPGETPILDCKFLNPELNGNIGLNINNATYLEFHGLTITNVRQGHSNVYVNGIEVDDCGVLTFNRMTVNQCGGAGFFMLGFDTLRVINCDSYNNADTLSFDAGVGNHADGFWILDGGGDEKESSHKLTYMYGCRAWNNSDDGIDINSSIRVDCSNTWSWSNGYILFGEGNGYKWGCSYIQETDARKVHNTISAFNRGSAHLDTNLDFGPWGEMYNNISWKDRGGFFSSGAGDARCGVDPAHVIYRNNLVYKPRDPDDESAQAGFKMCDYNYPIYVEQDHNTWIQSEDSWATIPNPDYTVTDDDFKLPHDSASIVKQLMSKRKIDGSLPDITCFKLKDKPGGNIIDGGIDVGLPYNGSAPDLGAFEYSSISIEITFPSDGIQISPDEDITIITTAEDAENTITAVKFYTNNKAILLGSGEQMGSSEWQITWRWNTTGSYDLRAVAFNNQGDSATSSAINILVTDNIDPSIEITSPSNNSEFTAPANLYITTNAHDPDGTISRVEFFNQDIKIGEKLSSPWSFTWNNVTAGSYTLTAVATDNLGATSTSESISVIVSQRVNIEPTVEITSPADNSEFTAPTNITIQTNAKDADGSVSKVEFFNQDVKIGETLSAPWSFTWNEVTAGSYTLTAVATDNLGATSTSESKSVNVSQRVNIEPTVEITSPADNSEFTAPTNITIQTNAKDADGSVSKVEFFNQDVKIGETLSAPWSFTWNEVTAGSYTLTAVATDNLGATSTSESISVNVSQRVNIEPTVEITSPADNSEFTAPANITIQTNAQDADGSVSKVEFFNQDVKIGETLSAPWSFTWNEVTAGSYTLTAVATDNLGATTTSESISVIVNEDINSSADLKNVHMGIKLYPNPNNGVFTLILADSLKFDRSMITIASMDGKVIYNEILLKEELPKKFDLSYIKPGGYLIIISGKEMILRRKFFKM